MKKKILNISTTDIGGAGSSAYRFHQLFKENGHESVLLVLDKYLKNKSVIGFRNKSNLLNRFVYKVTDKANKSFGNEQKLKTIPKYHFLNANETQTLIETKKIIAKLPFNPDAIFIYWVSNFINAKNIKEINEITGAPIFWILTDMGPLTGGCHYAWDCLGYTMDCRNCPALENEDHTNKRIAHKNLAFKKQHFAKLSISYITPTSILEKQFLKSIFSGFNHLKFLLPINTKDFQSVDKKFAKKHFSINENKKVIFIGCSDFNDVRKGMIFLKKSLQILYTMSDLNKNDILLLIAGNNIENFIDNLPFNYQYLNLIKTEKELCFAYSAAEIYACPSIEDSGPMMINESIICGTPVVAFSNVGVANDIVLNGKTGYLAKNNNETDFAEGLKKILTLKDLEYQNLSKSCKSFAEISMSKNEFYKTIFN